MFSPREERTRRRREVADEVVDPVHVVERVHLHEGIRVARGELVGGRAGVRRHARIHRRVHVVPRRVHLGVVGRPRPPVTEDQVIGGDPSSQIQLPGDPLRRRTRRRRAVLVGAAVERLDLGAHEEAAVAVRLEVAERHALHRRHAHARIESARRPRVHVGLIRVEDAVAAPQHLARRGVHCHVPVLALVHRRDPHEVARADLVAPGEHLPLRPAVGDAVRRLNRHRDGHRGDTQRLVGGEAPVAHRALVRRGARRHLDDPAVPVDRDDHLRAVDLDSLDHLLHVEGGAEPRAERDGAGERRAHRQSELLAKPERVRPHRVGQATRQRCCLDAGTEGEPAVFRPKLRTGSGLNRGGSEQERDKE